jgi:beta-N-acetylhexosaminidase
MNTDMLGPVILDIKGLTLTDDEARLLRRPIVGGLILFSRNYQDRAQLAALVGQVRALRPDMVIAVDQEGGRVQRFREGFTQIPPMQVLGHACQQDMTAGLGLTRDCGWVMAAELRSLDIDISFAPVLDLDDQYSRVIGDRSFSPDADLVAIAAGAFMQGMREAGMATTGKHFPGHGSVRADSHLELPVDLRSLDEIRERDLRPFSALMAQLDAIMPAHVLFPAIDANPVGFSEYWLKKILRGDLAFNGVVFSDDLSMAGAASAGSYLERAQLALKAGCDAVLICNSPAEAAAVAEALEQVHQPLSSRLVRMRSQQPAMSFAELQAHKRWRLTQERLAQLQVQRP